MYTVLIISQAVVSIALIVVILLQERSSGAGGIFGGGGGEFYHTRRGFEKVIFNSTIILGILFAVLAIINLLLFV